METKEPVYRTRFLSLEAKQQLVQMYTSGQTTTAIARHFGVSESAVRNHLNRRKVPRRRKGEGHRKFTFDEHFFDVIDTESKAYFLGFLFADGYNDQVRRNVVLCLAEPDKYIIEKFRECLKSNHPIGIGKKRESPNWYTQYKITLNSQYFSDRLAELGCYRAKTYSLDFPSEVPDNMKPHFVRGYFDGDGCICISQGKAKSIIARYSKVIVSFTSSIIFCRALVGVLSVECGTTPTVSVNSKEHSPLIGKFAIQGNYKALQFYSYCYRCCNATIYLTRKKEKFDRLNQAYLNK